LKSGQAQINSGVRVSKGKIVLENSPKLLIIGHFPGGEEYKAKEPFVGGAGKNILLLLSLVKHEWFCAKEHPFAKGDADLKSGLWQKLFKSRIAIINCNLGPVYKTNKNGKKVMQPGQLVLEKEHFRVNKFRELLTSNKSIPILVLGKPARKMMLNDNADVGSFDGKTFFWHHPDPQNAASGRFWGTADNANNGFKELLKFLKGIN
jgi:hypothetical protein